MYSEQPDALDMMLSPQQQGAEQGMQAMNAGQAGGQPEPSPMDNPDFRYWSGAGSNPVANIRNLLGGAAHGAFRGGQFLNEEMMKIPGAKKLAGKIHDMVGAPYIPDIDQQSEQMVRGIKSPNRTFGGDVAGAIGEAIPYAVAGGASLPGIVGSGAFMGAAETDPYEQNLGGYLPEGRLGGAIEGAALSLLPHGIYKGAKAAPGIARNISDYMHPERGAERFRSSLGQGTASENIAELGQRVKFGKGSATEEALAPKREIYAQQGKSDIYQTPESALPEGNIGQVAGMFDREANPKQPQMDALKDALKEYRASPKLDKSGKQINDSGDMHAFIEKGEEILGTPGLSESQTARIEDALSIPTGRNSKYLSGKDVDQYYSSNGNIDHLHEQFSKKPTLKNYDELQSALKKRERALASRERAGSLGDRAEAELGQLRKNISNLDADASSFMKTLPENLQGLEKEFRTKYATGVGKYTDAGEGARNIIRKLYKGKASEVTSAQIDRVFSHPTEQVKQILQDIGPEGGKNILYNALRSVKPGDAEAMANTVLELKRTKGFDQFVTPEMEEWANKMLKQVRVSGRIRHVIRVGSGAAAGGILGHGVGGAVLGGALAETPTMIKSIARAMKGRK